MQEDSSFVYRSTLITKNEWYLFIILVFSIIYNKVVQICTVKFFYTSTPLRVLSKYVVYDAGELFSLHFFGLMLCFIINASLFSQSHYSKKWQLKFNFTLYFFILLLCTSSILLEEGGMVDFKIFVYLVCIISVGIGTFLSLSYLYSTATNKEYFTDIKNKLTNSKDVVIVIALCVFFGGVSAEFILKDLNINVSSEAFKLVFETSYLNFQVDQYDFYIIFIFIYYYRLILNRLKIENTWKEDISKIKNITAFNLFFLVVLFIIISSIHFVVAQIDIISDYDIILFPNDILIKIQKNDLFNFNDYLSYLDEIGQVFFYQFIFVAIVVLKDKFDLVANQKRLEIIRQKDLENLLLKAKLDVFENQINAHFIFNTLNFISAKSREYSSELEESVELLAKILRYSLKNSQKDITNSNETDGQQLQTVALSEEIQHLENYIEIYRRRYNGKIFVDYELQGSTEYKSILPLTLINYVENAFKYGDYLDVENPIIIRIKIERNQLYFYLKNKKDLSKLRADSSKIGNKITLERLSLAYLDRYRLDILDEENFYTVSLNIHL